MDDPRLKAFESSEFDRVFGAVASLAGAADEERIDVPEIEADASDALARIVANASGQNPDPASRILLIKGATGTGKTHTLLTAIRRMHQVGGVYAALFPMVDLVTEKDLDAWLLRALISRLCERYLVAQGEPSPLGQLAEAILEHAEPNMAAAFRRDVLRDGGDIRDFDIRPLIVSIRGKLQKHSHLPVPSEALMTALLGAAAGDDDSLGFLRGQPMNASIGGVRLAQFFEDHVARAHIDALVNVIGATGGALFLAFDQLEQSRVTGWEQRLRHLFSRGTLLAETLPPLCVAYAVLPALYDTICDGIDGSIRDRIERFGALPVRLRPLGRRHVEALLKRRLAELYERCGAKVDTADPLYPFPGWMMSELGGQTSRYVFELIQQFRRVYLATGAIPTLDDMPPPPVIASEAALAPPPPTTPASTNFDDKWRGEITSRTVQPAIGNGIQQAEILEWAVQASAPEIDGITAIRTRRTVRGRAGTVIIEADFQKDGQSVERREIALCNEARGAPLAEEIRVFLRSVNGARPVIVRPRGGRLPRSGRFIAPLIRDLEDMQAIVVQQFEMLSWGAAQFRAPLLPQFQGCGGVRSLAARSASADEDGFAVGYRAISLYRGLRGRRGDRGRSAGDGGCASNSNSSAPQGARRAIGNAGRARRWRSGLLGAVRDGSEASQFRPAGHGRPWLRQNANAQRADRRRGPHGLPGLHFRLQEQLFRAELRAGDWAQGPRCAPLWHSVQPAYAQRERRRTGAAHRAHFYYHRRAEARFGLGDRQTATLRDAVKGAFEARGVNPQKWIDVDTLRPPSFDDVVAILEEQKEARNPQAIGLLDRIAPLFELGLFPKTDELPVPFEAMLDEKLVLSLFALPTDEIKAALAELIIIRLHGVLLRRAQPRKLTRLLVLDEAWRVANSAHLENLAREGRAFGAGIAIGTQYPGDLPPDLSGALDTKIYLKNQQPDHKKAVVRALCGSNSGPGCRASAWRTGAAHSVRGPDPEPAISALRALQASALLRAARGANQGGVSGTPLRLSGKSISTPTLSKSPSS